MSGFVDGLRERAAAIRRRIVFPEATDPRVIEGALRLARNGWAEPVVLGGDAAARALREGGWSGQGVEVLDCHEPETSDRLAARLYERRAHKGMTEGEARRRVEDPLLRAALLVGSGEVAGGVAGAVHTTGEVLRACLWAIGAAPGISVVSSSFYMAVNEFRGEGAEVLTFTDAAVVPEPDSAELADIAVAASRARPLVVGDEPRVALLSYSTAGSADGPSVRKVRDALARFREKAPDVSVFGEVQADAALISSVAARKMPGEPGVGRANVLVFPDLNSGNIAYKLVQRLAGAAAIGPIVQGLAKPFNDLSRGADADDIVNAACITALMSK